MTSIESVSSEATKIIPSIQTIRNFFKKSFIKRKSSLGITNSKGIASAGEHHISSLFKDKSRTILLSEFSYQQTTSYTCGPAAVVSLLNYYNKSACELTLAKQMNTRPISPTEASPGTSPEEIVTWLEDNNFTAELGEYNLNDGGGLKILQKSLEALKPVLVEWADWGGHWVLAVGYVYGKDPNGSLDQIIFADPVSSSYGLSNGLLYFNAVRFDSMWFDALIFGKIRRRIHIIATPK